MQNIKLIVSDLDGTLLKDEYGLSLKTKEVLNRLKDYKIDFMVATGRNFLEVKDIFKDITLNYKAICLNGAEIIEGEDMTLYTLSDEVIYNISSIARSNKYFLLFQCVDGVYMQEDLDYLKYNYVLYAKENEIDIPFEKSFFFTYPIIKAPLNKIKEKGIIKMELLYLLKADFQKLYSEFKDYPFNISTSNFINNIEIVKKDVSKGSSLERYCKSKKINKDEVMIFGDSLNDMSMFERFENTISPDNANPVLKKKAKDICKPNDLDGVALYIEDYLNSLTN